MKRILVIDGQGGRIGAQLIQGIRESVPDAVVTAVGSNSIATSNMLKAGATNGATGENAVVVGCRTADIIVGPIGIVIADALQGEITPTMAAAVGASTAARILIPFEHCDSIIVGVQNFGIAALVKTAIEHVRAFAAQ